MDLFVRHKRNNTRSRRRHSTELGSGNKMAGIGQFESAIQELTRSSDSRWMSSFPLPSSGFFLMYVLGDVALSS